MRRVYIASPYRGDTDRNVAHARKAMAHSLVRGEAPIAPHLLYPQVLDDSKAGERIVGMVAARELIGGCSVLAVYDDLGVSEGMKSEIEEAHRLGVTVELRRIPREAP